VTVSRRCQFSQRRYQLLTHKLKASLKEDRKHRVKAAGERADALLEKGDVREAWQVIRVWHNHAGDRPPSGSDSTPGNMSLLLQQLIKSSGS